MKVILFSKRKTEGNKLKTEFHYFYENNQSGLAVLVPKDCRELLLICVRYKQGLTHTNCHLDFGRILKRFVTPDAT